jgi:hypothetical protein
VERPIQSLPDFFLIAGAPVQKVFTGWKCGLQECAQIGWKAEVELLFRGFYLKIGQPTFELHADALEQCDHLEPLWIVHGGKLLAGEITLDQR